MSELPYAIRVLKSFTKARLQLAWTVVDRCEDLVAAVAKAQTFQRPGVKVSVFFKRKKIWPQESPLSEVETEIVQGHVAADLACGRPWQCACGPCQHARLAGR